MLDLDASSDKINESEVIAFLNSLEGLHLVTFTAREFELVMITRKAMVYALQVTALQETRTWYSFLGPLLSQEMRLEKPVSEGQYNAFRLSILDAYRKFRILAGKISVSAHPVDEEISHLVCVSLDVAPDPDERGGAEADDEGLLTVSKECTVTTGPRKSERFADILLKEGISSYLMGADVSDAPSSVIKNETLPQQEADQILGPVFKISTVLQSDILVVYLPEDTKNHPVSVAVSGSKGSLSSFRGSQLGKIVRAWEKA